MFPPIAKGGCATGTLGNRGGWFKGVRTLPYSNSELCSARSLLHKDLSGRKVRLCRGAKLKKVSDRSHLVAAPTRRVIEIDCRAVDLVVSASRAEVTIISV